MVSLIQKISLGFKNLCPIHHFKFIEAMNSKGIHVGIEI
jgi:hypothetical protein